MNKDWLTDATLQLALKVNTRETARDFQLKKGYFIN